MGNITTINQSDSQQIDTALASLRDLLRSPVGSATDHDRISAIVAALPTRTEPERALVRVVALLRQYFQADTVQSVIEVEAEDWADALAPFPDWAIRRACRWWQGAGNPKRDKKPKIGDIEEICINEMALVSMARDRVNRADRQIMRPKDQPKKRVTAEQAARIIRDVFGADRGPDAIGQPNRFPAEAINDKHHRQNHAAV